MSKIIYEDDSGIVYLDLKDGKLFLGADLKASDRKVGTIRHWVRVLHDIQDELKNRGVTELFAVVSSQDRFTFAEFMGFQTTGISFNDKYEVVRKELF